MQVDLQTFMTLTDNDLKELGINTFGARRKMLMAIQGECHFAVVFKVKLWEIDSNVT